MSVAVAIDPRPDLWPALREVEPAPRLALELALAEDERVVFVDLDGTLTDFVPQAYAACGVPEAEIALLESQIPDWGSLHVPLCMSKAEMWARIEARGDHFWSSMPWRETGRDVLREAERMGKVYLASSPTRSTESLQGKHRWVCRHLPEYRDRLILIGDKHLLAAPNRVLIDDSPRNCERFIAEGGQALLVAHAYNKKSRLPRLQISDLVV